MNIGMLWFDNDPATPLDKKVLRAAEYYQNKYGHAPNLCFIHPSSMPPVQGSEKATAGEVELRSNRSVLPNHFWIGVNNPEAQR